MAETQINQAQINLGSETAIDLLAMQNGWKKEMITAMNNKIANYASDADTMNTVVSKFKGMTGNTPDTVYKIFKGVNWGGAVMPRMTAMPTTSNDSWEITLCQKFKQRENDVLLDIDNTTTGIYLRINIGDQNQGYVDGYAWAKVPVYKQDEGQEQELEMLNLNEYGNEGRYTFLYNTKYWIKFGYGDGKYYCKVSTNGDAEEPIYETAFEITSSRKTQCKGLPATPNTPYLAITIAADGHQSIISSNILWLKECKVVIDSQTIFDGNDADLDIGGIDPENDKDVIWNATQVCHLVDVIQL